MRFPSERKGKEMTVKEMIERLSKCHPDMKVILDVSEGDGLWLAIERIGTAYLDDADTLHYDLDEAIEEVVAIRSLMI